MLRELVGTRLECNVGADGSRTLAVEICVFRPSILDSRTWECRVSVSARELTVSSPSKRSDPRPLDAWSFAEGLHRPGLEFSSAPSGAISLNLDPSFGMSRKRARNLYWFRASGKKVSAMGKRPSFQYRIEVWEINRKRYHAQIWPVEEWDCLPGEQRPATAMLVQGFGWVNLRLIDDEPGDEREGESD